MKPSLAVCILAFASSLFGGCAHDDGGLCGGSFKSAAAMERAWGRIPDPGPNSHTARY